MPHSIVQRSLTYGVDGRFPLELLSKRIQVDFQAPQGEEKSSELVRRAFARPVDFPHLGRAFLPGDRVAVVMDEDTPAGCEIAAVLIDLLLKSGVAPGDVRFLQPASIRRCHGLDSRAVVDLVTNAGMSHHRHDPRDEHSFTYLANTAAGERIYLARELNDADAVLTVGPVEFHPVLGVRGTASGLYPGLSRQEDLVRANGRGHDELGPEAARPWRQKSDEVAWLLGLQMSIAVVPAAGVEPLQVLTGQSDSVFRQAKETLLRNWTVQVDQRAEMVIVTVPTDAAGHGWHQVAAAIDVGRRLVERNGRIVVLSQLDEPPGPGLDLLRQARHPRDALKPIERSGGSDMSAACRIAAATDWAKVSLLSRLPPNLIDELFLFPLETPEEARRLIDQDDLTVIVENAQHCQARCNS